MNTPDIIEGQTNVGCQMKLTIEEALAWLFWRCKARDQVCALFAKDFERTLLIVQSALVGIGADYTVNRSSAALQIIVNGNESKVMIFAPGSQGHLGMRFNAAACIGHDEHFFEQVLGRCTRHHEGAPYNKAIYSE